MKIHTATADLTRANRVIEDIGKALDRVERYYEDALDGPKGDADDSGVRSGSSAGEPINLHIVDVRKESWDDVHYWCRFILDEVNQGSIQTIVRPELPEMLAFIRRWSTAIVDQFPDDAENLRREMQRHGAHLEGAARGWTVKRIEVGRCPEQRIVHVTGIGGEPVEQFTPCMGTLWAMLRSQDTMLPKVVICDCESEHQWQPWQWAALGRRIGQSIA